MHYDIQIYFQIVFLLVREMHKFKLEAFFFLLQDFHSLKNLKRSVLLIGWSSHVCLSSAS